MTAARLLKTLHRARPSVWRRSFANIVNIPKFLNEFKDSLKPPVSNKMIFNGEQLKVMVVGGPNQRDDFHVEKGEELFIQLKGAMELHVIEESQRKKVDIGQQQIYALPKLVPHSPQRFLNTIGIVVERARNESELDQLQWYHPKSGEKIYEESFHCVDLGTQLKPVIERFNQSQTFKENFVEAAGTPRRTVSNAVTYGTTHELIDIRSRAIANQEIHSLSRSYNKFFGKEFEVISIGASSRPNEKGVQSYTVPTNCTEVLIYQEFGQAEIQMVSDDKQPTDKEQHLPILLKEGDLALLTVDTTTQARVLVNPRPYLYTATTNEASSSPSPEAHLLVITNNGFRPCVKQPPAAPIA